MSYEGKNIETIALHAGFTPDERHGSAAVPIHQTTSYVFKDSEHAAALYNLEIGGHLYSRISNPTVAVLEQRVAALDEGIGAVATSSGMAALFVTVLALCSAGDHIVSSSQMYGGTYNQFKNNLSEMGIEVRFVDPTVPQNFADATDERTRAYFGETLPNPKLQVFPIQEVADIGREKGIPLIVDNTAAPILCRPFDHGAAVLIHSTTKFIGGHGTSIGGLIVDGGNFDWEGAGPERQPALNTPDACYNGVVWTEAIKPMGPIAYIMKARTTLLRDLGGAMSPFNGWMFIQGLETLPLRMREHTSNAMKVAQFLDSNEKVSSVTYPGLAEGIAKENADKYLTGGYGALIGFELPGGVKSGQKFIDSLELLYHVANIGDSRSLAIHPASTTHSQLSSEEQLSAGVTPGYVRLSIGIENIEDIVADIEQALQKAS